MRTIHLASVVVCAFVSCGGASGGNTSTCDHVGLADISSFYVGKGTISTEASADGCGYNLSNAGITNFRVCNLTVFKGAGAAASFDSYKSAAINYGPVSDAGVGERSYFSTQGPDSRDQYSFDIGFEKKGTAIVLICVAATSNGEAGKPQVAALMAKAAAKI